MLSDIVTGLDLNNSSDQKLIIATKDALSDLNFIFSEILSFYIKKDYCIVLLNFAQSSNHYNHLLLKSGINIRQLREQQNIVIIDTLTEIERLTKPDILQDTVLDIFSDCNGDDCLKKLYMAVKKSIDSFRSVDESKQFVIFIDEINVLLNLGLNLNAIEPFLQCCFALCTTATSTPNILFIGCAYDELDLQNAKLVHFLLHLSDIRIQVGGLKTGYSKDAHGKISLSVENKVECASKHQKLLFKVTEKGAKLLTWGL